MGFAAASGKMREAYMGKWREVAANFMVEPTYIGEARERSPYRHGYVYRPRQNAIILKDPETHKLVMTYASKLMLAIFGDPRGEYVQASPVGWEDAPSKAPTATRMLRYAFGLPGHYRTFSESIVDMLQFGTAVVELCWKYEEREMPVRSMTVEFGIETSSTERLRVPVYDDVIMRPVDIMDFYPDPANYRMQDMVGAAKRFRMNAARARRMSASGLYESSAVERALSRPAEAAVRRPEDDFRSGIGPNMNSSEPSYEPFRDMIGYEYWGEVPYRDESGYQRRTITILNNEVVRDVPYIYGDEALPFHALVINPIQGRFWGIAPAETVRYDQSFADAMKILLAEAVVRQVHPPIAFDPDSEADQAALRAWKADTVIAVRGGPASIGTLRYDANVPAAFQLLAGLKAEIQESSGAIGAIQGQPGPDRESASVGVRRLEFALDRPELAASIIEKDCLPQIGKSILRLYQQFLAGTEDLKKRIGELPEPVWIGDIMGDFDVQFVGSRQVMSRQQRLQGYQTLASLASAIPPLQAMIPWMEIGRELIGTVLELPEVAARVAAPEVAAANTALMQALGPGAGGGNGVATASQPPGMMPEQLAGGEA